MSTDPLGDLATTLEHFSQALRAAINDTDGNHVLGSLGAAKGPSAGTVPFAMRRPCSRWTLTHISSG